MTQINLLQQKQLLYHSNYTLHLTKHNCHDYKHRFHLSDDLVLAFPLL